MNVTALICELNPLHDGHKYIIDRARADADVLMLVMSGSFTERGVPAVYDKYARAVSAVESGADLVFELPYPWCSAGVEGFALGGVSIASSLGAGRLVFGSESGDGELIERIARIKSYPEYKRNTLAAENTDRSAGTAEVFDKVLASFGVTEPLGANDKLGAEYVRYGREAGISSFTSVKRIDAKSASEIRKTMPESAAVERRYNGILFDFCRISGDRSANELVRYAAKVAHDYADADGFIAALPTKKYTLARLRREILAEILNSNANPTYKPDFTVMLGANEKGREYLASVRKNAPIEIVTKPADAKSAQVAVSSRADELYCLCAGLCGGEMMRKKPFIL